MNRKPNEFCDKLTTGEGISPPGQGNFDCFTHTRYTSVVIILSTHVVLVHPEIHWNAGNAGRTCLAAGATLHLIEPLGFSLDERQLKRAGLDYWKHVDLRVWADWNTFEQQLPDLGDAFFFSTKAKQSLWDAPLDTPRGAVLIFGSEGKGLPPELYERYRERLFGMPMVSPDVRSLNLSTSIGIVLYEMLRQRKAKGSSGSGPV